MQLQLTRMKTNRHLSSFSWLMQIFCAVALATVLPFSSVHAQFSSIGTTTGLSFYIGDIHSENNIAGGSAGGGFTYRYHRHQYYNFRIGLSYLPIKGADSLSDETNIRRRNLSFKNNLVELSAITEVNLSKFDPLNFENSSPYVFGGLGMVYHSPYTHLNGQKHKLRPLGTEGQFLPNGKGPYSAITPFVVGGLGARLALTTRLHAGFEIGFRFLATDYLDDASTRVPDYERLKESNATAAVLSYRLPEVATTSSNPTGRIRGNPKNFDGYYYMGFHVSYSLTKSKQMTFREKFDRQRAAPSKPR
jgi:hypothetical protein